MRSLLFVACAGLIRFLELRSDGGNFSTLPASCKIQMKLEILYCCFPEQPGYSQVMYTWQRWEKQLKSWSAVAAETVGSELLQRPPLDTGYSPGMSAVALFVSVYSGIAA